MNNKKTSQKRTVLLAEDDASMRRFLEITLNRAGYDVISAEDGLAAMKLSLENSFDMVVTDAVMPNMSGHDLCRILRQRPELKETPLIILSGLEQEIAQNTEHDCADMYLVKDENLKKELVKNLDELTANKSVS